MAIDTDGIVGVGVAVGIAGLALGLLSKVAKTTAKGAKKTKECVWF